MPLDSIFATAVGSVESTEKLKKPVPVSGLNVGLGPAGR
jgi:hypothetical protein